MNGIRTCCEASQRHLNVLIPAILLAFSPAIIQAAEFNLIHIEKVMMELTERSMEERGVASVSVTLVNDGT